MIPLESPVPEIGTPGSGSGGWKRNHGSRTEDRSESDGYATGPYRRRASPRLYPSLALEILGGFAQLFVFSDRGMRGTGVPKTFRQLLEEVGMTVSILRVRAD